MLTQIARYGSPWWNIPVWFLLTLFFVKILTLYYSGGRTSTCVFILVTIVVALFHHSYIKNDFNYIGNTALATLFYILGFKSTKISISKIGYIAIGIIFLASILIIPSVLDIWSNSALYGNYFLAILGAGCGMLLVNKLFDICNFLQIRPLTFVGQNAMVFLICHVPIALAVRIIMLKDGTSYTLIPWIEAAVSIPVCLAVCIFFDRNRPFRWIIGG